MRIIYLLWLFLTIASCKQSTTVDPEANKSSLQPFTKVEIDFLHQDSTSIRALEVTENALVYAGSNGHYGILKFTSGNQLYTDIVETNKGRVNFIESYPSFRSIATTEKAIFLLSIGNPALLYRYDLDTNKMSLVYTEAGEKVFYDAMTFWNNEEGIAVGDATDGCLSILITRDGGTNWQKISCSDLPDPIASEGAFAASDTTIKVIDDETWLLTGGGVSRLYRSDDRGISWTVRNLPIDQNSNTQGGYSMDFYDSLLGIIYGGDYTKPEDAVNNIATTEDGGKTWAIVASNANDGYKSCVQFVPNTDGNEIIATGFSGMSYSQDKGHSWKQISDAPFLSIRFANDSIAYAGGQNVLARLTFKRQ